MTSIKPLLIFGYGNASRGDDALGPLLLESIQNEIDTEAVEIQTDFQLQIEHALDLENRELVLFVDASVACTDAYDFTELKPACDKSYTTHAMSPTALLQVFQNINHRQPPPAFLLSIRGEQFELGADLSQEARQNLKAATKFTISLLDHPHLKAWKRWAKAPTVA